MSGGMADAARQIARQQRRIDERIRRFKAQQRAKRKHRIANGSQQTFTEDVDLDCYWLCRACGFMQPEAIEGACPRCGSASDILDLNSDFLAEELRTIEAEMRQKSAPVADVVSAVAPTAAGLALLPVLPPLGVFVLAASLPAYYAMRQAVSAKLANPKMPARWTMPEHIADPDEAEPTGSATGKVSANGPLLTAPLSGKPCVAYEVSVLFDAPKDAWPPVWIVEETRSTGFSVGDIQVKAMNAVLHLEMEPIDEDGLGEGITLEDVLRARGLFAYDGEFELFEECLQVGDAVRLVTYADAATVCFPPQLQS